MDVCRQGICEGDREEKRGLDREEEEEEERRRCFAEFCVAGKAVVVLGAALVVVHAGNARAVLQSEQFVQGVNEDGEEYVKLPVVPLHAQPGAWGTV